jgi:prepilin-type N-terminal cleavage/methylation domain-containing protein/prepilin-type processing-associated H-X9-DG protein
MAPLMLRRINTMNSQKGGRIAGFTFLEVVIVVAVIAVLLAVLAPAMAPRRATSTRINCVNNLKQLGLGYRTWALDNSGTYPNQVSVTNGGAMEPLNRGEVFFGYLVMSNEISNPRILFCPDDRDPQRKEARLFSPGSGGEIVFRSNTNTTYFASLDAAEVTPNALLSGDRNIEVNKMQLATGIRSLTTNDALSWTDKVHKKQGNVGLADGSVQQLSGTKLMEAMAHTGLQTNRLVFP